MEKKTAVSNRKFLCAIGDGRLEEISIDTGGLTCIPVRSWPKIYSYGQSPVIVSLAVTPDGRNAFVGFFYGT